MRHAQIRHLQKIKRDVQRLREMLPTDDTRQIVAQINDVLFDLVETLLLEREGMDDEATS